MTNLEVPGMGDGVPLPVASPIKAGSKFSYIYIITGTAGPASFSGVPYRIKLNMQANSATGRYTRTSFHNLTLSYKVVVPTCSLGSAKNLSLAFGTLTSQDFATSQLTAEISLNCSNASQVDATLVPTQAALSDSMGVSATTLDGLSMAATWVDNGSAVAFNSPRTIALSKGDNLIRLGFRPRLNTPDSPAGEFSSQYTLNLTYR
ncbi:hypothetical protein HU727_003945 [Pseudomonas sp. SWRI153]|uniref:Fimbrial protein n=1 Tax=Pseudomonas khorasanensis TaxID=2745508 RepID=A0A923EZP0_9PSED|nr:hypothetical protein [Pseudomonas khorasanensis]MBV4484735.1 hypothetical protein [Pseudomonas khorasanensis]